MVRFVRTLHGVQRRVSVAVIATSLLCLYSFVSSRAQASFIQADSSPGTSLNGLPVKVRATFTTSANTLSILLTNLQGDPQSNVQNISGLRFAITTGQTSGSLTSSSGKERTVNSNRTFTDGSDKSTGWA